MKRDVFYYIIVVIAFVLFVGWMWFYWTRCAFTPIAEAPTICIGRR